MKPQRKLETFGEAKKHHWIVIIAGHAGLDEGSSSPCCHRRSERFNDNNCPGEASLLPFSP